MSRTRRRRLTTIATIVAAVVVLLLPATAFANDAHLTIVKTFDSSTAVAGSTIGFTITVQIHTDNSQDPLCTVLSPTTVQCSARGVTVTDRLPTTPAGLNWTIDAAHSNPGCNIGQTTAGYLTCFWGDMVAQNESRTVHVVSSTLPGAAGTCGTVINPLAHVAYKWEDGSDQSADATNAQTVVTCQTVTPPPTPSPTPSLPPTPRPTPTGSVKGATSPPQPHVTLPPTDAGSPAPREQTDRNVAFAMVLLIAIAAGGVVLTSRKPAHR